MPCTLGSRDNRVYALARSLSTSSTVTAVPSPTPTPEPAFAPLSQDDVRELLDRVYAGAGFGVDQYTVFKDGERYLRSYSDDLLDIFNTGYFLLTGVTPRDEGWVPLILTTEQYVDVVNQSFGRDSELKLALGFYCGRTADGLELIIKGSRSLPSALGTLAHEAGHARQSMNNPLQKKAPRESDIAAIREARAYAFEAAFVRTIGEYAGMNVTQLPVASAAASYFDLLADQMGGDANDLTGEHDRGLLLLWLAALHDPLLEEAKMDLSERYILSPQSLLAIHNRLIELSPGEAKEYIGNLIPHSPDDANLIGGRLAAEKAMFP